MVRVDSVQASGCLRLRRRQSTCITVFRSSMMLRFGACAVIFSIMVSLVVGSSKNENRLLLFISITSGPKHAHYRNAARESWLMPCQQSPLCDYRFFIDIDHSKLRNVNDTAGVHQKVLMEHLAYNDMVFRDSCSLMERHPAEINYGNAPYAKENMEKKNEYGKTVPIPDYPFRRVYKIDWKVCFLKWIYKFYPKEVDYHAFVEDDSYTCTKNLLYQLVQVKKNQAPQYHFRAGWPMYDGFDDSSTIMDNEIAKTFALHYPSPQLNCSVIEDAWNTTRMHAFDWSAWGNSWRSIHCNWRPQLRENFGINVSVPDVRCMEGLNAAEEELGEHQAKSIKLPCVRRPIVFHHWAASTIFTKEEGSGRQFHVCEYMLLIDKVKEPSLMHLLYNNSVRFPQHYHDFSDVFTHDKAAGWHSTLDKLQTEEKRCEVAHHNVSDVPTLFCLFDRPQERKRRLATLELLYPTKSVFPSVASGNLSLRGSPVAQRSFSFQNFVGMGPEEFY